MHHDLISSDFMHLIYGLKYHFHCNNASISEISSKFNLSVRSEADGDVIIFIPLQKLEPFLNDHPVINIAICL